MSIDNTKSLTLRRFSEDEGDRSKKIDEIKKKQGARKVLLACSSTRKKNAKTCGVAVVCVFFLGFCCRPFCAVLSRRRGVAGSH